MTELIDPSNYQDFTLETLRTPDGITKLNGILRQLAQNISSDGESVRIFQGVGTPEASVAAGVGSLYMRTDGGADTSVYRKESGSGNTGWVAITAPASLPLSLANGGTGVALVDPNADRILFWDDSAGQFTFLVASTGLAISGTNLTANASADYATGSYLIAGPSAVRTQNTTAAMTKLIEMYVPRGGTLKVTFGLVQKGSSETTARIYRNGSAVGTSRTNGTSTWAEYNTQRIYQDGLLGIYYKSMLMIQADRTEVPLGQSEYLRTLH
jgi:hypothetical protein